MGTTVMAITDAVRAAIRRLSELDSAEFVREIRALCREISPDVPLGLCLARLSAEGSIDAVAALFVLTRGCPEHEPRATAGLGALLRRNRAAEEELVDDGLAILLEQTAEKMGLVATVDRATGEKRWGRP